MPTKMHTKVCPNWLLFREKFTSWGISPEKNTLKLNKANGDYKFFDIIYNHEHYDKSRSHDLL